MKLAVIELKLDLGLSKSHKTWPKLVSNYLWLELNLFWIMRGWTWSCLTLDLHLSKLVRFGLALSQDLTGPRISWDSTWTCLTSLEIRPELVEWFEIQLRPLRLQWLETWLETFCDRPDTWLGLQTWSQRTWDLSWTFPNKTLKAALGHRVLKLCTGW